MNPFYQSLIQNLFKYLGGIAVAHGFMSDQQSQKLGGALIVIVATLWDLWNAHSHKQTTPPAPPAPGQGTGAAKLLFFLAVLGGLVGLAGCASVSPGSDPLVVRAEQSESIGYSVLDTVLIVDNSNRGFFQTNAPGFHQFCERLREPIVMDGTNVTRRWLFYIWSVENAKNAYKAGGGSTNLLVSSLAALETSINQAEQYLTAVKPLPAP